MAALNADRNTPERDGTFLLLPVAANTVIYAGGLVVLEAGVAKPGRTATGLLAVGRAEETANNSVGAAGALKIRVKAGVFQFANSAAADAIATADIGATAYIVDDQTVAKTAGIVANAATRSAAGPIVDIDAAGVWVGVGVIHP